MRRGETHLRSAAPSPAPSLRGALCAGDPRFCSDNLARVEAALLVMFCLRCPALAACADDRDRWAAANPEHWAAFTGVWGGRAWTRGKPFKGSGPRAAR